MFNSKKIIAIAAVVLVACSAFGQRGRGMFGGGVQVGPMLLMRNDVKTDLKLTDDQKSKLDEIQQSMRDKGREVFQSAGGDREKMQAGFKAMMEDLAKQIDAVLTPDQQTRLMQIGIQLAGNASATDATVQSKLAVTDDQKAKIADLVKASQAANQALGAKLRSQEIAPEDMQAGVKKNADILSTEIGKVLTDAQKAKLKDLAGPTFTPEADGGGR